MRLRHANVLSCVFDGATGDELLRHVHGLEEDVAARLEVDAELVELVLLIATAETEHGPAIAQLIEHRDIFQHAQRLIERRNDDRRAKPDALRQARHVGRHGHGRRAEAVVREVVLREPGDVEADLLCEPDLIRALGIDLARRLGGIALRIEAEESEMHGLSVPIQMPTMTSPPLGEITCPVTKSDSADARKATA